MKGNPTGFNGLFPREWLMTTAWPQSKARTLWLKGRLHA